MNTAKWIPAPGNQESVGTNELVKPKPSKNPQMVATF